jgi:hypothetical protein
MQVSFGTFFLSVFSWVVVMLLPILINIFQKIKPEFSVILYSIVYPFLIAFLSRRGEFWVSYKIIGIATVVATLLGLILYYVTKDKLKDESSNVSKIVSLSVFTVILGFMLFRSSSIEDMYNSKALSL